MQQAKMVLGLAIVLAAAAALAAIDTATPTTVSNGTVITVNGSGFGTAPRVWLRGAGISLVKAKVLKVPAAIDTTFQFVCPNADAGQYGIDVVPKGVKLPMQLAGITVALPAVGSVVPANGNPGIEAKLVGTHFGTKKGKVLFGTKKCKVKAWSDTEVTFVVPKLPAGAVDVSVTNTAGASAPKAGAFTIGGATVSNDQLTFDADGLTGDATDSGQSSVGFTSQPSPGAHLVITGIEHKTGSHTTVTIDVTFPSPSIFPITVKDGDVTIAFLRESGFPLYPTEDYTGVAGLGDDIEVEITSFDGTTVVGTYKGTLDRGALGTFGAVVFVQGTFTATLQ